MRLRIILPIALVMIFSLILFPRPAAFSQTQFPDQLEVYRSIIRIDKNAVRNIRWMEMWERHDEANQRHEWVVADYTGVTLPNNQWQLDTKCYHTFTEDEGVPIYMIDQAVVPVNSANTLWSSLKAADIDLSTDYLISSLHNSFVEAGCRSADLSLINGQEAESCHFTNQDPSHMFQLDPATGATSDAIIWSNIDGFPLRYDYRGEGQNVRLLQQYEAAVPEAISLTPPQNVGLMCFESAFPLPENTSQQGEVYLLYAAFKSGQTINQINNFYLDALAPEWILKSSDENSTSYIRALNNGIQCDLSMRFVNTPTGTVYSVEVFPSSLEGVPIPPGFEPLISSATPPSEVMPGSPQAVVEEYIDSKTGEGAVLRDELYFFNDNGAFAVLIGADSVQSYVMVERTGIGQSSFWTDELPPVCGPTFVLPRE